MTSFQKQDQFNIRFTFKYTDVYRENLDKRNFKSQAIDIGVFFSLN